MQDGAPNASAQLSLLEELRKELDAERKLRLALERRVDGLCSTENPAPLTLHRSTKHKLGVCSEDACPASPPWCVRPHRVVVA